MGHSDSKLRREQKSIGTLRQHIPHARTRTRTIAFPYVPPKTMGNYGNLDETTWLCWNITAAGAVDREFFAYIDPLRDVPEVPENLPKLSQSSPRPSQSSPRPPPEPSQSPPRGLQCHQSSLEAFLGGSRARIFDACRQNQASRNKYAGAPESAELVSRTADRSLPPHAPEVKMTVVKQTPSNYSWCPSLLLALGHIIDMHAFSLPPHGIFYHWARWGGKG